MGGDILAGVIILVAVVFVGMRFFKQSKGDCGCGSNKKGAGCGSGCGCGGDTQEPK